MKRRILNWLIALDQFAYCTLTLGHSDPDMTISADAWRWEQSGKPYLRRLRPIIDRLFWFDPDHCQRSYENEIR